MSVSRCAWTSTDQQAVKRFGTAMSRQASHVKKTSTFAALLFLLLQCGSTLGVRKSKANLQSGSRSIKRPNVIFILLDDMDKELGSANVMTKTQRLIREEGAEFVNAFVTTPTCCPSRTSILTGKYAHNHHTNTNNWNCSSPSWRKGPEKKTYARYMELAGYVTGHFGKYLNEYDGTWVPLGWRKWEGLLHNSKFYNYTLRHNNYKERHKMSYETDYFTDLITNRSISFIKQTVAANPNSPFLAVLSHSAPHGPETPAPQYSTAFPNAKAPRLPNWNFVSLDKQWILRRKEKMDAQKMDFVDLLHRRRLQTLLSVDDSVAKIFHTLQSLGIENETYIFFTSDHGYHLGQFALVKGKSMPFEADIRVPFYVRGPSIPKNIRIKEMIANIDIAPSFLDIAGVSTPRDMDGVSIMKLFRKSKDGRRYKKKEHVQWRDTILIERSRGWRKKRSNWDESSRNKTSGRKDNKVLTSRNGKHITKDRKTTLMATICAAQKHQSPCQPKQLWECVIVDGRYRLRKCRKIGPTTPAPPTPSVAHTTPMKMCVCVKQRLEQEDQGKVYEEQLTEEFDNRASSQELRRRTKRAGFGERQKKNRNELNPRRYSKELARIQKLQNRRAKSKMLLSGRVTGTKRKSNTSESVDDHFTYPGVVEEKLGKLKEKIWETKMRLEALRDRRKKLLMISTRDRPIEYLCPCSPGNSSSIRNGAQEFGYDNDNKGTQLLTPKRRNKVSRKHELKKKKVKTSLRRSKCSSPGVNCFYQTNYHWKLPPLWTGGDFCFCPNAANNSYWCLRTINTTHNFLYCEFVTHFLEFFDINQDPYQLYNVIHEVEPAVLSQLHEQLNRMRVCRGQGCTHYYGKKYPNENTGSVPLTSSLSPTPWTRTVNNENGAAVNIKNISKPSASTPGHSEQVEDRSAAFVSTPKMPSNVSNTAESSTSSFVTPPHITEGKGPEEDCTKTPFASSKTVSYTRSEAEIIPTSDVEGSRGSASETTNRPGDMTKVFVTTSALEPSSSYTASSTEAPTTSKLDAITLGEYSTAKPARRKSTKRRKNGGKEGKHTSKKSKKSKKNKKKSVGKGTSQVSTKTDSSSENENTFQPLKNQDKNSQTRKPGLKVSKINKGDNKKRNKKPSEKKLEKNTKKRGKTQPTAEINPGGVGEYETTASPL